MVSRGPTDRLDGGYDTARISAAEQDRIWREERQEQARQMLICMGAAPLAAAVGVDATPGPGTPCGTWAARVQRLAEGLPCGTCGTPALREVTR